MEGKEYLTRLTGVENMLIAAERIVAMRCPACGKMNKRSLGVFEFSGNGSVKMDCACGNPLLLIRTRGRRRYTVQVQCLICETPHLIDLTSDEIWEEDLVRLPCPDTQIDLGFLGQEQTVVAALDQNKIPLEEILSDVDYEQFFESPDVMWEVLQNLQQMASHGRLSCECGNPHIEIDIFPEKVELRCPQCEGLAVIYGEREEDARLIRETQRVELIPGTATYLDQNRIPSGHHKS